MKSLLIIAVLSFSFLVHAQSRGKDQPAIKVVPYAGYQKGSLIAGAPSQLSAIEGEVTGFLVGAKIGYSGETFGLGVDYSQSRSRLQPNDTSLDRQDWYTRDIGVYVKMNLYSNLSLFASYLPEFSVDEFEDEDVVVREEIKGDGYSAGLSFKFYSLLRIHVEYHVRQLKEYGNADIEENSRTETVMLSANFPVNFPYKFR